MSFYELIGWGGAFFLAICALPQAVHTYATKSAKGVSTLFLTLWGLGDILMLVYSIPLGSLPLIANYGLNAILIGYIVFYKIKGKA